VDLMLLPFFSMVDRRKSLHHEVMASAREQFPTILATDVPYSSEIERMSVRRAPIPAFAPHSAGAQIYRALWAEITARMRELSPIAGGPTATGGSTSPQRGPTGEHHAPFLGHGL
jgi:chromosome partitioning protein